MRDFDVSPARKQRAIGVARLVAMALVMSASGLAAARAADCAPPPGFVDTPHPVIAPAEQLVAHTEEITVERPLAAVMDWDSKTSLKAAIRQTGSLPGVVGEYQLNGIAHGTPGDKHIVCLTDGSTLEEEILVRELAPTAYRFRYVVWRYTTAQARPIEYGVGEFRYAQVGARRTHIVWTYAFKLKPHEFPGYLGGLGAYLFRVGFLDHPYAAMMRGTLENTKTSAEAHPG